MVSMYDALKGEKDIEKNKVSWTFILNTLSGKNEYDMKNMKGKMYSSK